MSFKKTRSCFPHSTSHLSPYPIPRALIKCGCAFITRNRKTFRIRRDGILYLLPSPICRTNELANHTALTMTLPSTTSCLWAHFTMMPAELVGFELRSYIRRIIRNGMPKSVHKHSYLHLFTISDQYCRCAARTILHPRPRIRFMSCFRLLIHSTRI